MTMFRFGCGHLPLNEDIHEASWGARLIYNEVTAGGGGVVGDRQTPAGDPDNVRVLFPVVNKALEVFREQKYDLPADSRGHLAWRDGRVLVVMSPQQSFGYLYITAVLEKEDHVGESEVWDMSDIKDNYGHPVPELGNWPPRVVEAKAAAERAWKRKRFDKITEYSGDLEWAERELRWAAGKRTEKGKQREVDKLVEEAYALSFELGLTWEYVPNVPHGIAATTK